MARELTAYGFGTTILAVPPGATAARMVIPPAGTLSLSLKYFSGSSLEVFAAPQGATTGSLPLSNGVTLGSGYLMGTTEVVNASGCPKFYLAATGATGVAHLLFGLSQGAS